MCPSPHVCPLRSGPYPCKLTSVAGPLGLRKESCALINHAASSQALPKDWGSVGLGHCVFTSSLGTPTSEASGQLCWARQSHQALGGILDWDGCTFLIWFFQGLKDVTILGHVLANFQTPNLKAKHRADARSTAGDPAMDLGTTGPGGRAPS